MLNLNVIDRLVHEEDGQNLIEYALVAGLLAVGAIAALTTLRTLIVNLFNTISYAIYSAM